MIALTNQGGPLAKPLSVAELAALLGKAGLLEPPSDAGSPKQDVPESKRDQALTSVCIDSRAAHPASVFVALKGARTDGHAYLAEAAKAGASAALIDAAFRPTDGSGLIDYEKKLGMTFLRVRDPLAALQEWARSYLKGLSGLLRLGITGSNGKTTSKELLRSILETEKRCFASPGNLNSVIGLPLAALAVPTETEVALFEMAMSEKGEMAVLASIVFPDLALITNAGTAHIGNIGSARGIALEKKQIFSAMTEKNTALIFGGDPQFEIMAEGVRAKVLPFGEKFNPGYGGWEADEDGQKLFWSGLTIKLRLSGSHNRNNALGAMRMAEILGVKAENIKKGIEAFRPVFGRGEIIRGDFTIYQDCYNANPDSMRASFEAFAEVPVSDGRKLIVLGDMKELGEEGERFHREVGRLVAETGASRVYFYGEAMAHAYREALAANEGGGAKAGGPAFFYESDFEALVARLKRDAKKGDLILLKASRSMALERVSERLIPTTKAGKENV